MTGTTVLDFTLNALSIIGIAYLYLILYPEVHASWLRYRVRDIQRAMEQDADKHGISRQHPAYRLLSRYLRSMATEAEHVSLLQAVILRAFVSARDIELTDSFSPKLWREASAGLGHKCESVICGYRWNARYTIILYALLGSPIFSALFLAASCLWPFVNPCVMG